MRNLPLIVAALVALVFLSAPSTAQDSRPDKKPGSFLANLLESSKPVEIALDRREVCLRKFHDLCPIR